MAALEVRSRSTSLAVSGGNPNWNRRMSLPGTPSGNGRRNSISGPPLLGARVSNLPEELQQMLIQSYRMTPALLVSSPEEETKLVQEIEELKEKKEFQITHNEVLKNQLSASDSGRPSSAPGFSGKKLGLLDVKRVNSDGDIMLENIR